MMIIKGRQLLLASFTALVTAEDVLLEEKASNFWTIVIATIAAICAIDMFWPQKKGSPPVARGLPLIGSLLEFLYDPIALVSRQHQKLGDIFTINLGVKKITYLIGPEVSRPFFKATDQQFPQAPVYKFTTPVFGEGIIFDAPLDKMHEQMNFLVTSFSTNRMRTYVQLFVQEANMYFGEWPDSGEVDVLETFNQLTILTSSRALMGREIRENLFAEVAALYHDLDAGMQPISFFFPNAPTAAHRRRAKAREEMVKIFSKVVNDRRASGAKDEDHQDFVQTLLSAKYKDGSRLSEDNITGLLICLLFAGQHTSSITSGWTAAHVIEQKDKYMDRIRKERASVFAENNDTELSYENLMKFDFLHACVSETLRMHPPLVFLMRHVQEAKAITSNGQEYVIPEGHVAATCPTIAGRRKEVHPNPDVYDPHRFYERKEDEGDPFNFIAFGGGRHQCMGRRFAYLQIKTILSVLFESFDLDLISAFPESDYAGLVVGPKGKAMVRYTRRQPKGSA